MYLIIPKKYWKSPPCLSWKRGTEWICKISVIIPTYNRKDILIKCLNALNKQTLSHTAYEVIVVDDGSNDGTEDAIKNLQLACKFTYLRQENKGPGAAKNLGIKHATGELLLFINDDIIADV